MIKLGIPLEELKFYFMTMKLLDFRMLFKTAILIKTKMHSCTFSCNPTCALIRDSQLERITCISTMWVYVHVVQMLQVVNASKVCNNVNLLLSDYFSIYIPVLHLLKTHINQHAHGTWYPPISTCILQLLCLNVLVVRC